MASRATFVPLACHNDIARHVTSWYWVAVSVLLRKGADINGQVKKDP